MPRSSRPSLPFACVAFAATVPLAAQHVVRQSFGAVHGDEYGHALASSPDIDGDGKPDLIVGFPGRDAGFLVDGGGAMAISGHSHAVLSQFVGGAILSRIGTTVASIGDVDVDGRPEWVAGAPGHINNQGAAIVVSGQGGAVLMTIAGEPGSMLGQGIAALGSVNSNTRPDLAVSAPHDSNTTQSGVLRFYDVALGVQLRDFTSTTGTLFGWVLVDMGDVTGDGFPDLLVTEPDYDYNGANSGRVMLYNPLFPASIAARWSQFTSFPAGSRVGIAAANIGDVNGDGKADAAVAGQSTRVYVLDGATGAILRELVHGDPGFGTSVAGVGDWDGDGDRDVAVGAPGFNNDTGRVHVFDALSGALVASINGPTNSRFGQAVAGCGDVDGDGLVDLAVGAPQCQTSATNRPGRVSVHGFDVRAAATQFGTACANSMNRIPDLYETGRPLLGQYCEVRLVDAPQNQLGLWLIGFSDATTGGIPLPYSLAPHGAPGCTVYGSSEVTVAFLTGGLPMHRYGMNVPYAPGLAGLRLYLQAAMTDTVNAMGLITSDAVAWTIGNM